jgi:cytochrome c-type biogenesis protein CcmH/NrfG
MRRETLAFTLAGTVFGFVVGYMAASWDVVPQPVAVSPTPVPAATPAPTVDPLDPDEVKALQTLAERQPTDVGVRVELGNLYMDNRRWDDAIRWYREALALSPALSDVATDLGASLVNSGRASEGLAEFEKVLQRDPDHRNALYNKGIALMQLGRTAEAAAAWEDLLKRHPDDPQVQSLRARIAQLRAGSSG